MRPQLRRTRDGNTDGAAGCTDRREEARATGKETDVERWPGSKQAGRAAHCNTAGNPEDRRYNHADTWNAGVELLCQAVFQAQKVPAAAAAAAVANTVCIPAETPTIARLGHIMDRQSAVHGQSNARRHADGAVSHAGKR